MPANEPAVASEQLFVAIRPSPAVITYLVTLTRAMADAAGDDVRWSSPDRYHVTLHYIGDAPSAPAIEAIEGILPAEPVTIELGPRLVELGSAIVAPAAGADALADRLARALAPVGPPDPDRPFLGHLTIGRWRRGRHRDGVVGQPCAGRFTATTFELLASVRQPESEQAASRYHTIRSWPLGAG